MWESGRNETRIVGRESAWGRPGKPGQRAGTLWKRKCHWREFQIHFSSRKLQGAQEGKEAEFRETNRMWLKKMERDKG